MQLNELNDKLSYSSAIWLLSQAKSLPNIDVIIGICIIITITYVCGNGGVVNTITRGAYSVFFDSAAI